MGSAINKMEHGSRSLFLPNTIKYSGSAPLGSSAPGLANYTRYGYSLGIDQT